MELRAFLDVPHGRATRARERCCCGEGGATAENTTFLVLNYGFFIGYLLPPADCPFSGGGSGGGTGEVQDPLGWLLVLGMALPEDRSDSLHAGVALPFFDSLRNNTSW